MKPNRTRTFALTYPVTLSDGTEVAEVTLTRAMGKTLRKLEQMAEDKSMSRMDEAVFMLTLISGQPEELFDEMDGEDLIMLSEALPDFFQGARQTGGDGEASSPTAPTS